MKDRGRLTFHLFTPRILKRANIRRNEERGYPNRLKKSVTKTIVAKKRTSGFDDRNILHSDDFSCIARIFRKSRSRKRTDKNISNIPRMSGNMPVPAFRKIPMGILKERIMVASPNRKRTVPPMNSSLLNLSPLLTMNGEQSTINNK